MTTIALVMASLVPILFSFPDSITVSAETNTNVIEWRLNVTGLVENSLILSWNEIIAMPTTTINAAIFCVDFPSTIVMEGDWTGVRLKTLLEEAQPLEDAIKVAFYADDNYSTDLTVEAAMQDDIIIAYKKDGTTLDNLRLVVPGKWGYKWIHHLARIELVNYDFLGFWEGFGYSDEADVLVSSPSPNQVSPSLPDFFVPPSLPTTTSLPSPKPYPSPSTTPAPSTQPILTPEPTKNVSIPTEVFYATAASLIVIVLLFTLILARKRR